ncbi:hypothetical protein [Sphingobacterium deserti]|uniref:Uncharacterized protein n=1 Tax=Sphingobacterium deserti TaxID=1229276 RepID=A0A0B8T730_9SPHI|nr:hypothetical protein [Sphingobacterium deserti]KGE14134.1 hypothetical protein DI53_1964 [Sphingobacterium deserti]
MKLNCKLARELSESFFRIKNMKMYKKTYIPPNITCTIVWLESSMAAMSTGARVNPGNEQENFPYVEDVQSEPGISNDFDL